MSKWWQKYSSYRAFHNKFKEHPFYPSDEQVIEVISAVHNKPKTSRQQQVQEDSLVQRKDRNRIQKDWH